MLFFKNCCQAPLSVLKAKLLINIKIFNYLLLLLYITFFPRDFHCTYTLKFLEGESSKEMNLASLGSPRYTLKFLKGGGDGWLNLASLSGLLGTPMITNTKIALFKKKIWFFSCKYINFPIIRIQKEKRHDCVGTYSENETNEKTHPSISIEF